MATSFRKTRRTAKLTLELPIDVIEFLVSTSKLAHVSLDTVIAVLLAMSIQARKVAGVAMAANPAASAAKKKGVVK